MCQRLAFLPHWICNHFIIHSTTLLLIWCITCSLFNTTLLLLKKSYHYCFLLISLLLVECSVACYSQHLKDKMLINHSSINAGPILWRYFCSSFFTWSCKNYNSSWLLTCWSLFLGSCSIGAVPHSAFVKCFRCLQLGPVEHPCFLTSPYSGINVLHFTICSMLVLKFIFFT